MTVREYWQDNAGEGCEELHLGSPQSEWSIVRHNHGRWAGQPPLTLLSPGMSLRDLDYRDDSAVDLEETLAACDIDAADIAALTGYAAVL